MAAEYSEGYREQAQQRLLHIESTMTPQAIAVARGLSEHFAKSWTPGLGHTEALLASASEQERQMNKTRREAIEKIGEKLDEFRSDLEAIRDEEQDYFDNMPESLQGGEKGQMAEEAVSALEEALSSLEEAIAQLNSAAA